MKNFIKLLTIAAMCFCMTSCVATVQAETDGVYATYDGDIDIRLVTTYGVPYYSADNVLLWYLYRNVYYTPRYFNGRVYAFDRHRTRPHFPKYRTVRPGRPAHVDRPGGRRIEPGRHNARPGSNRPAPAPRATTPSRPAPSRSASPAPSRGASPAPRSGGGHAGMRR